MQKKRVIIDLDVVTVSIWDKKGKNYCLNPAVNDFQGDFSNP